MEETNTSTTLLSFPPEPSSNTVCPELGPKSIKTRSKLACNVCRQRKSKCDGRHPCSFCITNDKTCEYLTLNERRKRGKGKANNAEKINRLNKRLEALESVLINLNNQLDKKTLGKSPFSEAANEVDGVSEVAVSESASEITSTEVNSKEDLETPQQEQDNQNICTLLQLKYFGNFSFFSIFSRDSVLWLKEKVQNDSCLIPLKNMPMLLEKNVSFMTQLWSQRPTELLIQGHGRLGYFPQNSALVFDILSSYSDLAICEFYLCPLSLVKQLFHHYYDKNVNDNVPHHEKHQFKYSDLILMNTILALCISTRTPKSGDTSDPLNKLSCNEINELKDIFFTNAISYYDKILAVNEGIRTVQCLGLMIVYVDFSHAVDFHITLMLTSVLIRYAQELGLHRLKNTPPGGNNSDDKRIKERLWWFCEHIDLESSLRCSSPPMINPENVSTSTKVEENMFAIPMNVSFDTFSPPANISDELLKYSETNGINEYFHYFYLMFARIRRSSYDELFSVKSQYENNNPEKIFKAMDKVNNNFLTMANLMDPVVRPQIVADSCVDWSKAHPLLSSLRDCKNSPYTFMKVYLQLSYFGGLLVFNRCPLYNIQTSEPQCKKYLNISNEASKSILTIIREWKTQETSNLMLSWTSQFAFMAYMALLAKILTDFNVDDIESDCELLIQSSMDFYPQYKSLQDWKYGIERKEKISNYDLIIRITLKILIRYMDITKLIDLYQKYPGLKAHVEAYESIFPQLFHSDITDIQTYKDLFSNEGDSNSNNNNNNNNNNKTSDSKLPTLKNIIHSEIPDIDPFSDYVTCHGLIPPLTEEYITNSGDDFSTMLWASILNLPNFFPENDP